MWRQAGTLATAVALAGILSVLGTRPALAECSFVPPFPAITSATSTARTIVVGEVVTDFDQGDLQLAPDQIARDYALRVTIVLRGDAKPGDLLDVQYLLPNWPWTQSFEGGETFPSCRSLNTSPGEVIALAIDALYPGGTIYGPDGSWVQPATRYNAMGVIKPGPYADNWSDRERVTLAQLEALVSLPMTDTSGPVGRSSSLPVVILLAGTLGFVIALRWTVRQPA